MVLRSEVRDISNSVSAMGDQLQREREDRKQDISEVHKRLDELNGRIDAVSKGSRADHGFSAVPPPSPMPGAFVASNDVPTIDPWMRYREQRAALGTSAGQAPTARHQDFPSPPSALKPDANDTTDYNHIVVGGWENDTPKKHIQDAITENLAHWDQAERAAVSKVVVYNQRARTGHVFLQSLPPDQARARFYAIQENTEAKSGPIRAQVTSRRASHPRSGRRIGLHARSVALSLASLVVHIRRMMLTGADKSFGVVRREWLL